MGDWGKQQAKYLWPVIPGLTAGLECRSCIVQISKNGGRFLIHRYETDRTRDAKVEKLLGMWYFYWVQNIEEGRSGTSSSEGTRFLGGSGGMLPQKFLKIWVSKVAISSTFKQILY